MISDITRPANAPTGIELGPLRIALEQLAEHGIEDIDGERCEQISSVFRVALCDLSPEQCAGIYAAMLLRCLPEPHTDG